MTTPFPGLTTPAPISWGSRNFITTPRLRGDCTNLAALFAGGARPLFAATGAQANLATSNATLVPFSTSYVNTWNVPAATNPANNALFQIPFPGYWLCQGFNSIANPGSNANLYKYGVGFAATVQGVGPANTDGGAVPGNTSSVNAFGAAGAELFQFNAYSQTADTLAVYGYQNSGAPLAAIAGLTAEWVGVQDVSGTAVKPPYPAASWPSGPGTYLTGGVAAGGGTLTVADTTGMITGGFLGLDYINGVPVQPSAEVVEILGITGLTVTISATSFQHLQNAPVAVPVASAFLNQQVRDAVRFLSYPPMLRAVPTTTQSIATGSSGVQIVNLSASEDNFSGMTANTYTVPVSGVYFVYGQVYLAGSTVAYSHSAGVSISGGTIIWGSVARPDTTGSATSMCATVRRHLRLQAGQTVQLYGYQTSGSSMSTVATSATTSKLIMVWRGM